MTAESNALYFMLGYICGAVTVSGVCIILMHRLAKECYEMLRKMGGD